MDRYVVVDVIGQGGMGIVCRALDPELERLVAIKLLRSNQRGEGDTTAGRDRLLREAKALARLSHPNVIPIYDVGTYGDDVFLAMEFVEGATLAEWLKRSKRSVGEVLRTLLPAGEGLAAAHDAGLIHRDFKPDNVIVAEDGRIRVIDFGIAAARERGGAPASGPLSTSAESSGALPRIVDAAEAGGDESILPTLDGAAVGTPRYMAPEQHLGEPTDARCDQFAFAVTLWEALYGGHPFGEGPPLQRTERVVLGKLVPPPPDATVPAWIRRALERALACAPDDRYPTMRALLDALRDDPGVARRRWLAWGAVAIAIGAALLGGVSIAERRSRVCDGADQRWNGVWDDARRDAVSRALAATGLPYAESAASGVRRVFDAYTREWSRARTDACLATRVRGEQSEELLDVRMQCFDQRLEELRSQVDVLARADAEVARRAVHAASSLPPLSTCNDIAALRAPVRPPTDPRTRQSVEEIGRALAQARALREAAKIAEGDALVGPALTRARALGYRPLEAEASLIAGTLKDMAGDYAGAAQLFDDAAIAAEAGHADRVAAQAWIRRVWVAGERQAHFEEGRALARHARATLERAGGQPALDAELAEVLSSVAYREGRYDEAVAEGRRAHDLFERVFGPDHPEVARSLSDIADAEMDKGDLELALDHYGQALALRERLLGRDHPDVSSVLNNQGIALKRLGRFPEAIAVYERALAIREGSFGESHPHTAATIYNLGEILAASGDPTRALPYEQRALDVLTRLLGADHPDVAEATFGVGEVLRAMGRLDDARERYERALAIETKALGDKHPALAYPLVGLAEVAIARGNYPAALASLERALALRAPADVDPVLLASTRVALARALCGAGREVSRARELAAQAREAFVKAGRSGERELAALDAWRCAAAEATAHRGL